MARRIENGLRTYNILLWRNKIWESKVSNTGDLAITLNSIRKLKAQIPGAKIHMFSDDPEYTQSRYGICAYPIRQIFNPVKLYCILKKMDLVILGGGTILQDNNFIGVIPINISVGLIAKLLGKKVACNAIGVASDSEISYFGKILGVFALKRFDSITVRHEESKHFLEKWTKGQIKCRVTSDMAVDLLAANFERLKPALKEEGIDIGQKDTVAIAPRRIFHREKSLFYFIPSGLRAKLGIMHRLYKRRVNEFKMCLAQFCDYIIGQYDVKIVFIPFYSSGASVDTENIKTPRRLFSSEDNRFAQDVYELMQHKQNARVLQKNYKPEEIITIISKCKAMIGVPYHSIVFASSQNVPVIGINYVSKVGRYMRMLGMEDYAVPARIGDGVSLDILKQKFDKLWRNRVSVAKQLEEKNPGLAELSNINISILKKLLQED